MTSAIRRSPFHRFVSWVSGDVVGGSLMITAAAIGLMWANTPWQDVHNALSEFRIGPESLNLNLTIATWAADGLLAIFFFVVGVELKHEIVVGSLRNVRTAAVPFIAAIGGMVVPAIFYTVVILVLDPGPALDGWAIPTATDIAFALAILAIFGRGLPIPLRVFLLTLAVVDDLLAVTVIAIFYSKGFSLLAFVAAIAAVVLFGFFVRMRRMHWWILIPLALVAWGFMHESGVHATVAGVMLGLTVPARRMRGEDVARTTRLEHSVRPVSAAIALPVFAFFAAGVTVVGGGTSPLDALSEPVAIAIIIALIGGKLAGVLGATAIVIKTTKLRLPENIGVRDLLPIAFLTGIGFTVSLLIAELSFESDEQSAPARFAILVASVIAATLAAVTLRWDAKKKRKLDMNEDGVIDPLTDKVGDPGTEEMSDPETGKVGNPTPRDL